MRAHLIAAFSVIGSGVFVGGGVGRGIHDDAVEEGLVLCLDSIHSGCPRIVIGLRGVVGKTFFCFPKAQPLPAHIIIIWTHLGPRYDLHYHGHPCWANMNTQR